jgi:hypothetical protein
LIWWLQVQRSRRPVWRLYEIGILKMTSNQTLHRRAVDLPPTQPSVFGSIKGIIEEVRRCGLIQFLREPMPRIVRALEMQRLDRALGVKHHEKAVIPLPVH